MQSQYPLHQYGGLFEYRIVYGFAPMLPHHALGYAVNGLPVDVAAGKIVWVQNSDTLVGV